MRYGTHWCREALDVSNFSDCSVANLTTACITINGRTVHAE